MIEWLSYALIGVFAGASAGLLGLGGGLVSVPALLYVFSLQDLPEDYLMHIAVSTSLMTIMITSCSSLIAHHRNSNIHWVIVRRLIPGLSLGALLGAYLASSISSQILQWIFAVYALLMSIRIWISIPLIAVSSRLLAPIFCFNVASVFGLISALVGMGGGTMVVPYLLLAGQTIRKAIGTSAACAFPIAMFGVMGYVIFGQQQQFGSDWQTGFIHWQAFLGMISTSIFAAPIAARWAKLLPLTILEKLFSLVLMLVSLSLFFG